MKRYYQKYLCNFVPLLVTSENKKVQRYVGLFYYISCDPLILISGFLI